MDQLPFAVSIAFLSLFQGATVGLARPPAPLASRGRRSRVLLAALPALSILAFVGGLRLAPGGADVLTYVALCAVPPLAAVAFGWLVAGPRPSLALLAGALLALAYLDRGGLFGELATLTLIAASCVTLGSGLALLCPPLALKLGIVAMAVVDTALVVSEQLQRPNRLLEASRPPLGLPQLQNGLFGSAVIGYGDLFIAATLGALLALERGRRWQLRGALVAAALALAFDLLFFWVRELPATVPVAGALLALEGQRRLHRPAGAVRG